MPRRKSSDMTDSEESEYQQSSTHEESNSSSDEEVSESEFAQSEIDGDDTQTQQKKRKGRKPRNLVQITSMNGSLKHESQANASTAGSIVTPVAAASSSSSSSLLPPSQSPISMRFASTGETAQGTLQHHQTGTMTTSDSIFPGRVRLARSATDGALAAAASRPLTPDPSKKHVCDYPGCAKAFTKVGKLNRHKLSHTGSRAFACTYAGCNKTFARNDRLRRHWKIHQNEALEAEEGGGTKRKRKFSISHASDLPTAAPSTKSEVKKETNDDSSEPQSDHHMMSGSDWEGNTFVPEAILRPTTAAAATVASSSNSGSLVELVLPPTAPVIPPSLPPLVKFHCTFPGCGFSFLLREHLKRHEATHPIVAVLVSSAAASSDHVAPSSPTAAAATSSSSVPPTQKRSYPCTHIGCFLSFDKAHKLREHAFVHTGVLPWICNMPLTTTNSTTGQQSMQTGITRVKHEDDSDEDEHMDDEEHGHAHESMNTAPAVSNELPAVAAASSSSSISLFLSSSPHLQPLTTSPRLIPLTSSPRLLPASGSPTLGPINPTHIPLCQEGFMTKAQMLKHQRLIHGPARFVCGADGCGVTFQRFMDLIKHRSTVHRLTELVCLKCGLLTKTKAEKDAHAQTHMSMEEREKFLLPCPFSLPPFLCEKKFTRKGNLNIHIRAQHDAAWKDGVSVVPKWNGASTDTAGNRSTAIQAANNVDDSATASAASSIPPIASGTILVRRFPCPFPACLPKMQRKPYGLKCTLHRHLMKIHGLTKEQAKDDSAIAQAVERDGHKPLPPHPNSLRPKVSQRTKLVGATTPYQPSLARGLKRAREEEETEQEQATTIAPTTTESKREGLLESIFNSRPAVAVVTATSSSGSIVHDMEVLDQKESGEDVASSNSSSESVRDQRPAKRTKLDHESSAIDAKALTADNEHPAAPVPSTSCSPLSITSAAEVTVAAAAATNMLVD